MWLKPDVDAGVESPVTASFRELARESAAQFADAIRDALPEAVEESWLSSLRYSEESPSHDLNSDRTTVGGCFGCTPFTCSRWSPLTSACPPLRNWPRRSTDRFDSGGALYSGIGWSAIVTATGASGAGIPLRLIEVHWAYIALYMEIDRGLLGLLDDDRWYEPESLGALEEDADRVFTNYMRVMHARARLDSDLASLGGDEFALWEEISDVTKFDPLVEGVDRKVEVFSESPSVASSRPKRDARTARAGFSAASPR